MLDSIYHMTNTLKYHFWRKHVIILSLWSQRCYGRHNVSRKSINHSGLSILLHGIISLADATSNDNVCYTAIGSLSCLTSNWFLSPLALQETGALILRGDKVTE